MRPIDADALNIDREHFDTYADYSHAFDMIDNAPTIDAVPVRHGKWEMKPDPFGFFHDIPVCSECGRTTKMREKTLYCPHCGARMVEDER